MKDRIIDLLKSTNRPNIDALIEEMEKGGFFTSPCSGAYHLCKEGGLAEHSLNVYEYMTKLEETLKPDVAKETIVITSILHDLGKMGDRNKSNYVPNYVNSKTKNKETGEYDKVLSTAKPYVTNKDLFYIDHEVRSVMIAERFIELTEEEEISILWHNGMYGNFKYNIQGNETPLYMLLHFADMWASRVIEKEDCNG